MVADLTPKWQDDAGDDREEKSLLPQDPLGQRFLAYFNHPWHFIYAPAPQPGERPGWKTETRYPLQPRNLWNHYQNPEELLGIRFGTETNYLLQDIDSGSQYHPANSLERFQTVLSVLEEIGLCRPVVIQSSLSGGIHVYYFLPEKVNSFSLSCAVAQALRQAGILIRGGQLELFPNPKPYGKGKPTDFNAHRLPLQEGSYLLDWAYQPYSDSLEAFLDAAHWSAAGQDNDALQAAIAQTAGPGRAMYRGGYTANVIQWRQHLEERLLQGFTDYHQTNELLKDIACYGIVFCGLEGEMLVEYVVATVEAAPGYRQFCRHQHEIRQRATERARSCEAFYRPYPSTPNRLNTYKEQFSDLAPVANNIVRFSPNEQRHARTLARVATVVETLKGEGMFPASVSDRSKAIITASKTRYGVGVSQTTLHKPDYLALWHPLYEGTGKEAGVNEYAGELSALQPPEKYPALPDPWWEEDTPELLVAEAVQGKGAEIYTLPPYMKVLCLPGATSPAASLPSGNTAFLNSSRLDQQSLDENPPSIQSCSIDKLHLCPSHPGGALENDKQPLSMTETLITAPVLADVADSKTDSNGAIRSPETRPASIPLSTPDSPPSSLRSSLPDEATGRRTGREYFSSLFTRTGAVNTGESLPMPAETAVFTPEEHHHATRVRIGLMQAARKWVTSYSLVQTVRLTRQERLDIEVLAQRILMAESGVPLLWQEARAWFAANGNSLKQRGLGWIVISLFPDLSG